MRDETGYIDGMGRREDGRYIHGNGKVEVERK